MKLVLTLSIAIIGVFALLLVLGIFRTYRRAEGILRIAIASGEASTDEDVVFHFASMIAANHGLMNRRFPTPHTESAIVLLRNESEVKRLIIPAPTADALS